MSFNRLTTMAEAFAKAALRDKSLNLADYKRWLARNVADKLLHADRNYSVREYDKRPEVKTDAKNV